MDYLAKIFMESPTEKNAFNLVNSLRKLNLFQTAILIGKCLSKMYPYNPNIRSEIAVSAFYSKNYSLSYDLYEENLKLSCLTESQSFNQRTNQHFSISHISNRYNYYNLNIIKKIRKNKRPFPLVTFTITTCKRYNLFEQTMNTFLNCCSDIHLIDKWFCVDDNSSKEDREKMKLNYPFFNFYWKTPKEKGHPQSMNIIQKNVKTEFIFHMEDDWKYFCKKKYISQCIDVLGQNPSIGQCLINRNYSEIVSDIHVKGGKLARTLNGLRFYLHEHTKTPEERLIFTKKYGQSANSSYWPHFSFRPSLLRTEIFQKLGSFNEKISNFELDYSNKYTNHGYISSFLEGIYCLHIGRTTHQRHDKSIPNAYELNDELQFSGKEEKSNKPTILSDLNLDMFVINLDRRPDRYVGFIRKALSQNLKVNRFPAIDGKKLIPTHQLLRLFDGNDYDMRKGMVGITLSHIQLWIDLLNSDKDMYVIFEDDVSFGERFIEKLIKSCTDLQKHDWGILFLGHHLKKEFRDSDSVNPTIVPNIEKMDSHKSLIKSMGGAFAYIINKEGARKMLDFINKHGMTNGIDTMQQKAGDEIGLYYCYPHIVYSRVAEKSTDDSDIQFKYDSLSVSLEERIKEENDFYGTIINLTDDNVLSYSGLNVGIYKSTPENIKLVLLEIKFPHYTITNNVIVIVPNPTEFQLKNRCFHVLKNKSKYNINNAIKYK